MAKGLPAAFVALVIGLIAALIAYRQMKIADEQRRVAADKLSFDLFKERYQVFETTREALLHFVGLPGGSFPLKDASHRARFLFGPEIYKYLDELTERCAEVRELRAHAYGPIASTVPVADYDKIMASQSAAAAKANELVKWLADQADDEAAKRFFLYLDFSRWRPGAK